MRSHILLNSLALAASAFAATPHPGEKLYQMNCMACHQVQTGLVGPSLVEMSKLYPTDKGADFIKWAKEPFQKRKGAIEMPSMAHIGDDGLAKIHDYILLLSEGKKEIKPKATDPFADSPAYNQFPRTQRLFIENAGPAAIAVLIAPDLGTVWDVGQCKLRYIATSKFSAWGDWEKGGRGRASFAGELPYKETASHVLSIASGHEPDFAGYSLKSGLPTFKYKLGAAEITETINGDAGTQTITRTFQIKGLSESLTLNLAHDGKASHSITTAAGTTAVIGNQASLTLKEAAAFTLSTTLVK